MLFRLIIRGCLLVGCLTIAADSISAQPPEVLEQMRKAKERAEKGKPGGAPNQPGEKPAGEAAENGDPPPKVIRRDDRDPDDANPDELKATVGDDGKVAFHFREQSWDGLIGWLSEISDHPIDWLELPGDQVNLRSPGRYTVEQTRDLFNRHLLARGYTLLEVDAGSTVVSTENINPAIVPRVDVDRLKTLPPYTFVRTTMDAGWLSAEKLAEEFKPLISAGGKLTALTTTNQIEGMDAAANLADIAGLLQQQRDDTSRQSLAPEMRLRYVPAEQAKTMLEQFLGIDKKSQPTLTPQQIEQMQRRGQQPPPQTPKEPEVSIVANVRQNSVLIRGKPDRVAIAMEFLKRIDVPSDVMATLSDVEKRVEVVRLTTLDPEKLIEIVSEMNILEPATRIRADKENAALIVSGSPADRYIIQSLVTRLDGSGRSFEVLPLRRLDPIEVAETIQFLMGQKKEEDDSSRNRRSYYYYDRYRNDDEESGNDDEFRVAANTRYRQIMLWANDQEMKQVEDLLIKLGELPPPGGSPQTVRIIDASASEDTMKYLRRIKSQFEQMVPNEISLPDLPPEITAAEVPGSDEEADGSESESVGEAIETGGRSSDDVEASAARSGTWRLANAAGPHETATKDAAETLANDTRAEADSSDAIPPEKQTIRSAADFDRAFGRRRDSDPLANGNEPSKKGSPVQIEFDADGNLVISSSDTAALDRLETLMRQLEPPKRPYEVFHIEHASAFWIRTALEDYFNDGDGSEDSEADSFFRWYWGDDDDDEETEPAGLGKASKMKFVDDIDTNTLVVSGASGSQLRTIRELIALWDVPEPVNKRKTRFTKLVRVRYGQAEAIAETVKEAYRDLLSSNDKTFQKNRGGGGGGGRGDGDDGPEKSRRGSGSSLESGDQDGGGTDFSFKGKLSLGIDPVGNTLLVSAEGESLLELIVDMIDQLDEAAQPAGQVEVLQVSGSIDGEELQRAMEAFGGTASGAKPNGPAGGANFRPRGPRGDLGDND